MKSNLHFAILLILSFPAWVNAQNLNGNVGIGTLTPTARLQINHKSSADVPSLLIQDSAGGDGATIVFRSPEANGIWGDPHVNEKDFKIKWDQNMYFMSGIYDKSSPYLFLESASAKVGIGTSTPNARLQINHKSTPAVPSLLILDSAGGNGATIGFHRSGGLNNFNMTLDNDGLKFLPNYAWFDAASPYLALATSGNVGIGTASPASRFQINHTSTVQSPNLLILDSANGIGNMIQFQKQGSNTGVSFTTNLSGPDPNWSVRRVDQTTPLLYQGLISNRTGIGTSNPQATLDVNGSLRIIGVLIALNSAGQPGQVLTSSGPNDPPSWQNAGNNNGPIVDSLPFHAYNNNAEIVLPGENGKIIGTGGTERFDLGNNYNPQTATYTCHEGVFHFNARISSVVGPIDSDPHNLNLIIEVVDADNTTIKGSYESVLIVPAFVKNNTTFTTDVNTIIQVQENEKVRVRVKHDRLVNMNIKLEEFSCSAK